MPAPNAREWPGPIATITLFAEDLEATRAFYREVFGLPVVFEDPDSAVFRFGSMLVNLLRISAAPELVSPAPVASPAAGVRSVFTLEVDDVDATWAELARRGAQLLNGPLDRPWGVRTASFRDPAGHIWEIAH
ncbi:MAG: VOC family protein [Chloroflexi bacterium]|nr:VOC family protein [Chloroflexota bacterium]